MNVKSRKAISPLIATLLLIAIAVAASVLTYSWVMSMVGSQATQAQTQMRIDSVTWKGTPGAPANGCDILVRNTGSVATVVESVSIRINTSGSAATIYTVTAAGGSVDVGGTKTIPNSLCTLVWTVSTSYVIRITTNTGFYYETTATTPAVIP